MWHLHISFLRGNLSYDYTNNPSRITYLIRLRNCHYIIPKLEFSWKDEIYLEETCRQHSTQGNSLNVRFLFIIPDRKHSTIIPIHIPPGKSIGNVTFFTVLVGYGNYLEHSSLYHKCLTLINVHLIVKRLGM